MKRILLIDIFLFFITAFINVFAVPAYPKRIPIISNGDTVYIQMRGDENCKFAIDESGYTVLSTENGWFYATEDKDGKVSPSIYPIVSKRKMDNDTKQFLEKTRKGLIPVSTSKISKTYNQEGTTMQAAAVGSRKVLVILMQFRDKKFTKEITDFQRLFNEEGYTEDGAIGSVYDYYKWASYGQLHLTSDVLGPYTAKYDMAYYGGNSGVSGNDRNPYALFEEAINEAIKEVNLSDYDANGDGYVDNIHIIYAGFGEEAGASANAIWAHEMTFRAITLQGMKIDKYSCAPELRGNSGTGISRIGPHCHEIGHALGAMDYYDTNYATDGSYLGTGNWDIMASGSWNNDGISPAGFNPYVKIYNYGWTEAQTLADSINLIKPSTEKDNIYRIDTGTKNDYFLLENRNGKDFHAAEPGSGLLIFHIGPQLETKATTNTINSTYPQQCYVVCASSTAKRPTSSATTYGNINSGGCPYPGSSKNHEFSDETIPAALTVSGNTSGIRLSDINLVGNDVSLVYGNSKNSDTTITDGEYFWQEDFEQMRIPSSWEYSDIIGFGEFTVTTKLSIGGTPQSPEAASGKGYAKYSTLSKNGLGRHNTRGILSTPIITLDPNKHYQFFMQARKSSTLEDARDSLFINLYDNKGISIKTIISSEINNQNQWEQLTASLPDSINEFSLGIECNIDYGSIMFIDDMKIMESSDETGIVSINHPKKFSILSSSDGISVHADEDTELRIYNYGGMMLYKDKIYQHTTKSYHIRPGIYIIYIGNERLKFRLKKN